MGSFLLSYLAYVCDFSAVEARILRHGIRAAVVIKPCAVGLLNEHDVVFGRAVIRVGHGRLPLSPGIKIVFFPVEPFDLTVIAAICTDPDILSIAVGKQLAELFIVGGILYRCKMASSQLTSSE